MDFRDVLLGMSCCGSVLALIVAAGAASQADNAMRNLRNVVNFLNSNNIGDLATAFKQWKNNR